MTPLSATISLEEAREAREGWPEPDLSVLSERSVPPPYLSKPFEPFWAGFIAAQAEHAAAPPDYVASALIVGAAQLIGNARWVSPWSEWREPCVLRIANVGDPSTNKTPAERSIINILKTLEAELGTDFDAKIRRYETEKEAARVERLRWQDDVKTAVDNGVPPPDLPTKAVAPNPPVLPRIIIADITPEELGEKHAVNPKGLLSYRPELASWFLGMDRYNAGGERALWLEAFNGGSHVIDRKSNKTPIHIRHLSVGVLGGIQPDRLASLLFSGDDDGLAARFLYVWPDQVPRKRPTAHVNIDAATCALRRLARLTMSEDSEGNPKPITIQLDLDAATLFEKWWQGDGDQEETHVGGMFKSHLGKLSGILLRIALTLEFLWWSVDDQPEPRLVGKAAVACAIQLIEDYYRPMALRAFGEAALPKAERNAATLAKRILKQKLDQINASEIRRKWKIPGLRNAQSVKEALLVLEDANWIRPPGKPEIGRPPSNYEVNPLLASSR